MNIAIEQSFFLQITHHLRQIFLQSKSLLPLNSDSRTRFINELLWAVWGYSWQSQRQTSHWEKGHCSSRCFHEWCTCNEFVEKVTYNLRRYLSPFPNCHKKLWVRWGESRVFNDMLLPWIKCAQVWSEKLHSHIIKVSSLRIPKSTEE